MKNEMKNEKVKLDCLDPVTSFLLSSKMTIFEQKALLWLMKNTDAVSIFEDSLKSEFEYHVFIDGEPTCLVLTKDELLRIFLKNFEVK